MALSIPAATDRQTDRSDSHVERERGQKTSAHSLNGKALSSPLSIHPFLHRSVNLSDSDVWYLSQRGWPRDQVV